MVKTSRLFIGGNGYSSSGRKSKPLIDLNSILDVERNLVLVVIIFPTVLPGGHCGQTGQMSFFLTFSLFHFFGNCIRIQSCTVCNTSKVDFKLQSSTSILYLVLMWLKIQSLLSLSSPLSWSNVQIFFSQYFLFLLYLRIVIALKVVQSGRQGGFQTSKLDLIPTWHTKTLQQNSNEPVERGRISLW